MKSYTTSAQVTVKQKIMPSKELPIILSESTKTISKSPGWVPLSILCYLLIKPETLRQYSLDWFADNYELSIGGLVVLLYLLGDILDKYLFPRNKGKEKTGWSWITNNNKIESTRAKAQNAVAIQTGVYKVSKAIVDEAGGLQANLIQMENESAKFFRSLCLPVVALGLWNCFVGNFLIGIFCVLSGIMSLRVYGVLKGSHMSHLYSRVSELVEDSKYQSIAISKDVQLHLWDGRTITTSKLEKNDSFVDYN